MVAIGKPEDLLRRRPDIRRAERGPRRLHRAHRPSRPADLFPRLNLHRHVSGAQAQTVPSLFQAGSAAYNFSAPSLKLGLP